MSIKKRGATWWIDITSPSGERIRRSTGTTVRRDAQEYHDKLKAELWAVSKLGEKPARLFEEAIILMLRDAQGQKRLDYKQSHAEYFLSVFAGKQLSSIDGDDIANSIPTHNLNTRKKLSPATQNRYRTTLLRCFSLAYKMGWIDSIPFVPKMDEPKVRVRWITKEQARLLINNLSLNWMKQVSKFALMTGARMSEILTLTWGNVDFDRRIAIITSDKAKSGRARALALNDEALVLLKNARRDGEFVFHRNGKKISEVDRRDFKRSCKLSGIEDFRFHDLRHTWASWHVQAGTPLFTLKELGGWETLEMVKRYAHLNSSHLLEHAVNVTFTAQSSNLLDYKNDKVAI